MGISFLLKQILQIFTCYAIRGVLSLTNYIVDVAIME